jgi:hypothetical protein
MMRSIARQMIFGLAVALTFGLATTSLHAEDAMKLKSSDGTNKPQALGKGDGRPLQNPLIKPAKSNRKSKAKKTGKK